MTAAQLLADLKALGVAIEADESRLRLYPKSKVTPELLEHPGASID